MFTVITVNVSGKILSGDYTSGFNRVTAKFSRVEFTKWGLICGVGIRRKTFFCKKESKS